MSHVVDLQLSIKHLADLEAACKRLGLEFVRNQTQYRWYGKFMGDAPLPKGYTRTDLGKCSHAIRVPGNSKAYEIGVVPSKTVPGEWELVWDNYAGGFGMVEKIGNNADKLRQSYAASVAIRHARAKGFRVTETVKQDGTLQLLAMKR